MLEIEFYDSCPDCDSYENIDYRIFYTDDGKKVTEGICRECRSDWIQDVEEGE